MDIQLKIHSVIHYLAYFIKAKTKFKIHSPFVFTFITTILESSYVPSSTTNLIKFYKKNFSSINYKENKGAGSSVLNRMSEPIDAYISKVGIPEKYGKVLAKLATSYENATILELGTSLGISTSHLSSTPTNTVHTIEGNEDISTLSKNAFKALNMNNVYFYTADFDDSLLDIAANIAPIDIAFIDGNHTKKATLRYVKQLRPYLSEKAVVIIDDIYWSKGMTEAWHEIRSNTEIDLSIDLFRMGLLFFRKEQREKEHFVLWY